MHDDSAALRVRAGRFFFLMPRKIVSTFAKTYIIAPRRILRFVTALLFDDSVFPTGDLSDAKPSRTSNQDGRNQSAEHDFE
jgi:hypothetical protein